MNVTVNGEPVDLPRETRISDVVSRWCTSARGVAVAKNGDVVARSTWDSEAVSDGDAIEIVSAVAGG